MLALDVYHNFQLVPLVELAKLHLSRLDISSRSHNSTARTVYETLRGEFEKSGQKNRGVRVEFRTITVALELLTLCVHLSADWIETRKKLEVSLNTQGT